jgi:hypothetical protein
MPPAVVEAVQEKCDEWTQVSNEVVCVGKIQHVYGLVRNQTG